MNPFLQRSFLSVLVYALPFLAVASSCGGGSSASPRGPAPDGYERLAPVVLITDRPGEYDEGRSRLKNLLEGMGLEFEVLDVATVGNTPLSDYQAAIVAGSSARELVVDSAAEASIIEAIENGTSVLWIGSGIWGTFRTTNLPDAFGIRYLVQGWSGDFGIDYAGFTNLDGSPDRFDVRKENVFKVEPANASVEGVYLSRDLGGTDTPFVTMREGDGSRGSAIFISMPILDYWKAGETFDTYARAEVVQKYVLRLLDRGAVKKHPSRDAKDAVFILRLEDYTPGGTWLRKSIRRYALNMERLLELVGAWNVPLNIGIVPRYTHPFTGEYHQWDSRDAEIQTLKSQAQRAFDNGGSLIVHGYYHQNGEAVDDLTAEDWEMWDEDREVFLPYEAQKAITDSAFAEIQRVWGVTPTIWETPHYSGNEDTYRAVAATGFKYVTESDTKLFPNRDGFQNQLGGRLLNIPETAFDFRLLPEDIRSNTQLKQLKILPRLARMNGLFYVFYHNLSMHQYRGLENFLETARQYDLWKAGVEDYASFWERRERVNVASFIDPESCRILARVSDGFEGFTLAFQAPKGATVHSVTIDGVLTNAKTATKDGRSVAYPVLVDSESEVMVGYTGPGCDTPTPAAGQ